MRGDVMGTMEGFAIFPVITLIIFVGFFAGLIYYVVTMDKSKVDKLSDMPFDDDDDEQILTKLETEGGEKNGSR